MGSRYKYKGYCMWWFAFNFSTYLSWVQQRDRPIDRLLFSWWPSMLFTAPICYWRNNNNKWICLHFLWWPSCRQFWRSYMSKADEAQEASRGRNWRTSEHQMSCPSHQLQTALLLLNTKFWKTKHLQFTEDEQYCRQRNVGTHFILALLELYGSENCVPRVGLKPTTS